MKDTKNAIILSGKIKGSLQEELRELQDTNQLPRCKLELPSNYLSVSQVLTYTKCPMQYYWRYVKGITIPPMARLTEGRAMHKALEVGLGEHQSSGEPAPLDVFLDAYHDAWGDMKGEIEDWDEEERVIENRDRALLTEYRHTRVPKMKPARVESRFWAPFGKSTIPVVGFVDLVDFDQEEEKHFIVDHKVVAKSKSQNEADNDLQLTVYSHVHATADVRFDSFVKTKKPKISIVKSQRTNLDGLWAEKVFETVGQAIASGTFPACDPSGWACTKKWCGYAKLCRWA